MKKVTWGPPKITTSKQAPGTYRSYKELLEKANVMKAEQDEAQEYLKKSMPAMLALIDYKLRNREPLIVMRPLRYQTSELNSEEDDGFYKSRNPQKPEFKDIIKTIMPGTRLMLKSLDLALGEFVFEDGLGKEHALNFCERNNLMTQTNVFEEVKNYLENIGE
jgi:hypothetical protein